MPKRKKMSRAEAFVRAYAKSSSYAELATRMNLTIRSAQAQASKLRSRGVVLPTFPITPDKGNRINLPRLQRLSQNLFPAEHARLQEKMRQEVTQAVTSEVENEHPNAAVEDPEVETLKFLAGLGGGDPPEDP